MRSKCRSIATFHRPIHSHWSLPLILSRPTYNIVILVWRKFKCDKSASGMLIKQQIVFTFTRQSWRSTGTTFISYLALLVWRSNIGTHYRYLIHLLLSSCNNIIISTGTGTHFRHLDLVNFSKLQWIKAMFWFDWLIIWRKLIFKIFSWIIDTIGFWAIYIPRLKFGSRYMFKIREGEHLTDCVSRIQSLPSQSMGINWHIRQPLDQPIGQ